MKNKLNKFFRRCIPLLSAFMVVVASIPYPVQAEDLSWKDYITDVLVDEGVVYVELPATPARFDVYLGSSESTTFNNVESAVFPFEAYEDTGVPYHIEITPSSLNYLYLGNIPNDTELNVYLDIRSVVYPEGNTVNGLPTIPAWNFSFSGVSSRLKFYDSSHKLLDSKFMELGYWEDEPWDDPTGTDSVASFTGITILSDNFGDLQQEEYFNNAQYFRATYAINNVRFSADTPCKLSIHKYELAFHMGSLLSSDGEYSDILEVILSELSKRGQTINLITGDIENIPQIENNMNNAINGAGDSVQDLGQLGDALAGVDKPNLNPDAFAADQLVPQTSFIVLAMPFQELWENRTLFGMLTIVVSLVLVSWLFFGKKR